MKAVWFVSSAYFGSASDRQIIERSSLLNHGKWNLIQDLFVTCNKIMSVNALKYLKETRLEIELAMEEML